MEEEGRWGPAPLDPGRNGAPLYGLRVLILSSQVILEKKNCPLHIFIRFGCPFDWPPSPFRGCIYYLNDWYVFPPPLFQNNIFLPSTVKISSFPPFVPPLTSYIRVFYLKKLSYFFPNQPITHILAMRWGQNEIHPCTLFLRNPAAQPHSLLRKILGFIYNQMIRRHPQPIKLT